MRLIDRLGEHVLRVRRHAGKPVKIGDRDYRVAGYFSNIVAIDDAGEPEVLEVMRRVLKRDGHFIDVGVNLGQTLGRVLTIDPTRAYLGFEPQVAACHYVTRFLHDNAIGSANVLPIGLSDHEGIARFWSQGEADTMASLVARSDARHQILIPVRKGDDVLRDLGITTIAAIKIDVEGAELSVMHGFAETLNRDRPPVIFEVLPNFVGEDRIALPADIAAQQSRNADAIFQFLSEAGYDIFVIAPDGSERAIAAFSLNDAVGYLGMNYVAKARSA